MAELEQSSFNSSSELRLTNCLFLCIVAFVLPILDCGLWRCKRIFSPADERSLVHVSDGLSSSCLLAAVTDVLGDRLPLL